MLFTYIYIFACLLTEGESNNTPFSETRKVKNELRKELVKYCQFPSTSLYLIVSSVAIQVCKQRTTQIFPFQPSFFLCFSFLPSLCHVVWFQFFSFSCVNKGHTNHGGFKHHEVIQKSFINLREIYTEIYYPFEV